MLPTASVVKIDMVGGAVVRRMWSDRLGRRGLRNTRCGHGHTKEIELAPGEVKLASSPPWHAAQTRSPTRRQMNNSDDISSATAGDFVIIRSKTTDMEIGK